MELTRDALLDTLRCPVCGTRLAGPHCGSCGADLGGPEGAEVHRISVRIAELLDRRVQLVAAVPRRPVHSPAPQPVSAPPAFVPPLAPRPAPRPGIGVHGVLLGVGALLLAVAAVSFLVFAWHLLPLAGRAAVIGGITVAVLGLAAWLRRRLPETGEAVGALGVVLLLADAGAVRATGLLGADAIGLSAYLAGAGAVLVGVLLGWAVPARVRAGTIAAAVLGPLACLFAGIAAEDGTGRPVALGLLAAGVLTLVRGRIPRSVERQVLTGAALVAVPLGALVALAGADDDRVSAAGLLLLGTLVAAAQARPDRSVLVLRRIWSAVGGVALAVGVAVLVDLASPPFRPVTALAAAGAVAVLLALPAVRERLRRGHLRAWSASGAAAVVAGLPALAVAVPAVEWLVDVLGLASPVWRVSAGVPVGERVSGDWVAALVGGLVTAVWTGALARLRRPAAGAVPLAVAAGAALAGAVAMLVTFPLLPVWAVVVAQTVVAVAAAALAVRVRRAAPLAAAALFGTGAVWLSWADRDLTVPVLVAAAAALLLARRPAGGPEAHAVLGLGATVTGLVAVGAAARWVGADGDVAVLAAAVAGLAASSALLTVPRGPLAARPGRAPWSPVDRVVTAAPSVVPVALAAVALWDDLADGRGAVLAGAVLLAAAAVAVAPLREVRRVARPVPVLAAVALAPAAGLLAVQLDRVAGFGAAPELVLAAVTAAAGLLAGALVQLRGLPAIRRIGAEAGVALTGVAALALVDRQTLWAVLLLLGLAAAAVALARDRDPVRWLTAVLLVGSTWARLALSGVRLVEAYSVPAALALLLVVLLRPDTRRRWPAIVAPFALTPSVLASFHGYEIRPALLLAAAAALALLARPTRGATAVAALTAASTAIVTVSGNLPGPAPMPLTSVEVWSLTAAAVLLVAGYRATTLPASAWRESWVRFGAGLAMLLLPSLALVVHDAGRDAGAPRVVLLTVLAGAALLAGARARLQAPVVTGAVVLVVHGLVQLSPYIATLRDGVPPWAALALLGMVLVTVGATYERRLGELRAVRRRLASLG